VKVIPVPPELQQAACKYADPKLFDATSGDRAEDALSYCDRCPVVTACHDYVLPARSHFDGVAAGKIWRDGVSVDPALFEGE
jgi:hypothetical protein